MDCSLINEESSVFLRNQHVTQNRLSFAGSQTLLASENKFNSTGSFNSKGTVGDARRLGYLTKEPVSYFVIFQYSIKHRKTCFGDILYFLLSADFTRAPFVVPGDKALQGKEVLDINLTQLSSVQKLAII